MRKLRRVAIAVAATVAVVAGVSACSTGSSASSGSKVTLHYGMWDDTQVPAYQKCVTQFEKDHPNITIKIDQTAWGQYWTNLSTEMAAGSAPDVFVDQASYYPQFVKDKQIVDLSSYVKKDKVNLNQYVKGLAKTWVVGKSRYGLPKDWDTIAFVYNKADVKAAGIDPASLSKLTWNAKDGGTFEQTIAKLTIDKNGKNGLDPAFDKNNVKTYGYLPEWSDGSQGQNGWGNFAASNGWTYSNKNPFGTKFNYSSSKLTDTVQWLADLSKKGYTPKFSTQSTLARSEVLANGGGALTTLGSANLSSYKGQTDKFGFASLPIGPEGRKSAINGLSDAIYAGTKHKDEAWEWVKYLGSSSCQNKVASTGVVFPAIKTASAKSAAVREKEGLDAQVFIDEQQAKDGTFAIPVSYHGTEINQIVQDAIQAVALGKKSAKASLTDGNKQVNALFNK